MKKLFPVKIQHQQLRTKSLDRYASICCVYDFLTLKNSYLGDGKPLASHFRVAGCPLMLSTFPGLAVITGGTVVTQTPQR
jgi:hypothetical protein